MASKIKEITLIFRTVSHLRPTQVAYQFKNKWIKPRPLKYYRLSFDNVNPLLYFELPIVRSVLKINQSEYMFDFLNLRHTFQDKIDWDFQDLGKLWNYNLQYVDFLRQQDINLDIKNEILKHLYETLWSGKLKPEPYPASLRIMNVIRFLSVSQNNPDADLLKSYLKAEVNYLSKNLEYHLFGNHLLENGFALLMGGYYFKEKKWIKQAEQLLLQEVKEQILEDGAHFELSPMYHQILLFRVLEAIKYLDHKNELCLFLREKVTGMLSWLRNISFKDGSIPHFNDATDGIAFTTPELFSIAERMDISSEPNLVLKESGYRKIKVKDMEFIMDIHGIAPSYQPGHAHADTFSFCLQYNEYPIVVDPSISTYNIGPRRDWERSTNAHNTIEIDNSSSSEMWAGFRVGRRALVSVEEDKPYFVQGLHNGYENRGMMHRRSFAAKEDCFIITDQLLYQKGKSEKIKNVKSYLHFYPDIEIQSVDKHQIVIAECIMIELPTNAKTELKDYDFALGYNQLAKAKRLEIDLRGEDFSTITFTILK